MGARAQSFNCIHGKVLESIQFALLNHTVNTALHIVLCAEDNEAMKTVYQCMHSTISLL